MTQLMKMHCLEYIYKHILSWFQFMWNHNSFYTVQKHSLIKPPLKLGHGSVITPQRNHACNHQSMFQFPLNRVSKKNPWCANKMVYSIATQCHKLNVTKCYPAMLSFRDMRVVRRDNTLLISEIIYSVVAFVVLQFGQAWLKNHRPNRFALYMEIIFALNKRRMKKKQIRFIFMFTNG